MLVFHGEFVFGLGLGLFFAGLLVAATPDISNSEIERRARELGMVRPEEVFSFEQGDQEVPEKKDVEVNKDAEKKDVETSESVSKAPPKQTPETHESAPPPQESAGGAEEAERKVTVVISPGSTLSQVAGQLEGAGVIEDKEEFLEYFKSQGLSNKLRVGTYELKVGEDFDQLALTLCGRRGSGNQ